MEQVKFLIRSESQKQGNILELKRSRAMQPINKQDVLIRLLKDGHISDEEFKALWESMPKPIIREITCGTGGSKMDFKELEDYEKRIKPDSKEEYYMTVGKPDPLTKEEIDKISKDYYDAFNETKAIKDSLR